MPSFSCALTYAARVMSPGALVLLWLTAFAPKGDAQEIPGKVVEVNGSVARVTLDPGAAVSVGDRVKIVCVLPEIGDEASVGTGQIVKVEPGVALATITE